MGAFSEKLEGAKQRLNAMVHQKQIKTTGSTGEPVI
jgi:hypothetical protein